MSNPFSAKVALIGRPNVGKSTLFNKLTRSRKAVVKDEAGVARDILIEPVEWWGHQFQVVDTGGLTEDKQGFAPLIRKHVLEHLRTMDLLVVIMDGRAGLVPEDRDLIRIAKEMNKPFVIVVNKVDRFQDKDTVLGEFYEVGEMLIGAAFESDQGIDEVVEWIICHLPSEQAQENDGIRVTFLGKPNVGKSSLVNALLGESRMLVSDTAGTTVDSVETPFMFSGRPYVLVDTAGLRRQARRRNGIEFLSAFKSMDAVRRADVTLLVIDACAGPSAQDAKLLEECLELHRAVLVVANKSDLAKEKDKHFREWFRAKLEREFHFFPDVPVVFSSAKTGLGLKDVMGEVDRLYAKLHTRIPTSRLNKFFFDVIRQAPAPVFGTANVKFYYLTQTKQLPPSFIAFANHPQGVTPAYRRFLTKRIQREWDLRGVPIRIFVMASGGKERQEDSWP